jgi:hypothetical protein
LATPDRANLWRNIEIEGTLIAPDERRFLLANMSDSYRIFPQLLVTEIFRFIWAINLNLGAI